MEAIARLHLLEVIDMESFSRAHTRSSSVPNKSMNCSQELDGFPIYNLSHCDEEYRKGGATFQIVNTISQAAIVFAPQELAGIMESSQGITESLSEGCKNEYLVLGYPSCIYYFGERILQ